MKKLTPLGTKTAILVMEDRMIADVKPRAMQLYFIVRGYAVRRYFNGGKK